MGLAAGAAGTAALELSRPVERAIAGGAMPFAPGAIAAAFGRALGRQPSARTQAVVGRLLRWSYGPGWGALYGLARGRRDGVPSTRRRALDAASLAAAILALELLALPPLVGRSLFRGRVLGALVVHVGLFAAVAELVVGRAR